MKSGNWGRKFKFPEFHLPEKELLSLRHQVDTLGDDIFDYLEKKESVTVPVIEDFLLKIVNDTADIDDKTVNFFSESVKTVPDWLDQSLLQHGQLIFLRFSMSCSLSLLYASLVGGFSAPKITEVLDKTGYLTTSRVATFRRLMETYEMVFNCVCSPDAMCVGGVGWMHVLKVRFIHSRVRKRILQSNNWKTEEFGLPLNQEDMLATLLSFSASVLISIEELGAPLTPRDRESYLHLWRYVGHLLGINHQINACTDFPRAVGALESIVSHLLQPSQRSREIAHHVIESFSTFGQSPLGNTYALHSQCARYLLGHSLANELHIEWYPFSYFLVCMFFGYLWYLNYFRSGSLGWGSQTIQKKLIFIRERVIPRGLSLGHHSQLDRINSIS